MISKDTNSNHKDNPYKDPFSEIIGHHYQIGQLKHMLSTDCVPHAIMLSGQNGIGKRLVARALAASIVCDNPVIEQDYRKTKNGNHPDVHLIFKEPDKRDIPVEEIRQLCRKLQLTPYCGLGSVGIIDNAHDMSLSAHNALLMTLEEPCKKSKLILVTHSPNKMPETIISRCQIVHFGTLSAKESQTIISQILTYLNVTDSCLEQLFSICKDNLSLLNLNEFIDPISLTVKDKKALSEHLSNLSAEIKNITSLLDSICNNKNINEGQVLSIVSELSEQKGLSEHIWHTIHSYFRDKIAISDRRTAHALSDVLTQSLEAHELVRHRSANLPLQLSSLLLKSSNLLQNT